MYMWYPWNSRANMWSALRAGQLRQTMGESLRFGLVEFSLRLRIIANPSAADRRCKKRTEEGLRWERRGAHHRRMVLQSIIDDPTCICGAGHVLKPVSRSVLRIACARIGSGYPHNSIPALPPLPLWRLDSFTPPFAAGSSDFREARMWAGPDSRLPTPYFRR